MFRIEAPRASSSGCLPSLIEELRDVLREGGLREGVREGELRVREGC